MVQVDTYFGNGVECHYLVELLNKPNMPRKKVRTLFKEMNTDLRQLSKAEDKHFRRRTFYIMRDYYLARIDCLVDEVVIRNARSVFTIYFRRFMKSEKF